MREDSRCIAAKDGLRVVYEKDANMSGIEDLRYSIDVFDVRDNLTEALGRLTDLDPAAAVAKYPAKRIVPVEVVDSRGFTLKRRRRD